MTLRDTIKDSMKRPKADVGYSVGMPNAHCGLCRYYSNHLCEKVQGPISPDMWCKLFEKRGSTEKY